ncbi:MAG: Rne/Rng family ribonuclease [Candidatus Kapaibacteriales bacterium]
MANTKKHIIINSTVLDDRVAILENGNLAEYFVEEHDKQSYIGNIYLGKVSKILQGINAAFINIGLGSDGFLHFSDVDESMEKSVISEDEDEGKNKKSNQQPTKGMDQSTAIALRQIAPNIKEKNTPIFSTKSSGDVLINLKKGQDVIVQVTREAYSTKGVKLTTKVALPGRYMVLLPFDDMLGVSQKIANFNDRKKLRAIVKSFRTEGYGCIIRTVAKGRTAKTLEKDWLELVALWRQIESKVKSSSPPTLLYNDLSLAKSIVRDHVSSYTKKISVDSRSLYNDIYDYLNVKSPKYVDKVEYIEPNRNIFQVYGIDKDLQNVTRRQVYLPNGGSIVIDSTEAMQVIDVNSGRGTESDAEKTAFMNNMEALKEVAKQIRLRDMAGIIVIDFIDMAHESNQKKLFYKMQEELKNDRAKWVVYPISGLGLMQISRQRINQNILEKVTTSCNTCNGTGRVPTISTIMFGLENWLRNFRSNANEFKILLEVSPELATHLSQGVVSRLSKLMFKYFLRIKLVISDSLRVDEYRIFSIRQQKEITRLYN